MNGKLARALRRYKSNRATVEDILRLQRNLIHKRDQLKTAPKPVKFRVNKHSGGSTGLQGYTDKQRASLAKKLPIVVRPVRAAQIEFKQIWNAAAKLPFGVWRQINDWALYSCLPKWALNKVALA